MIIASYTSNYYYGGYGYGGPFYYDWTILLMIAAFVLTLIVQGYMKSTASKYSRILSSSGLTGREAARKILDSEGLTYVSVGSIPGNLTDHYDPRDKSVSLSDTVYNKTSLTAIGVAAHECGHAIQDAKGYSPLALRSSFVPVANLGSQLAWPVFFIGLIFSIRPLLYAGIILFLAVIVFQLVTLPVEFNASRRALKVLQSTGLATNEEIKGSRAVLSAAALTYVAALTSSILQLIRLLIIAGGRRRD